MTLYLYRRGDGNEGNFPRFCVNIADDQCPFAALAALVANERIPGSRTRRHIMREIQTEGEREHGINAWVYEGPDGEEVFGAAWLTAELEPYTEEEYARSPFLFAQPLRDVLDSAAWRYYRKQVKMKGV